MLKIGCKSANWNLLSKNSKPVSNFCRPSRRWFNSERNQLSSGHNKWSTIKHDKAKNDAEKNKLFNKFANQIALAVKVGGSPDPSLNIRLATIMEAANKNNVSKKVVDNAIKKAQGISINNKNVPMETCLYEGMGPGGVAFVIEALTDNKNRTIGYVRSSFTKANGSMTPTLYFFDKKGYVVVQAPEIYENDEDKILEKVIELEGVEDLEQIQNEEETDTIESDTEPKNTNSILFSITTEPTMTNSVAAKLKADGFSIKEVGIGYFGKEDMLVTLSDEETKAKHHKFMNVLDSIDEITSIHTNLSE